MASPKLVTTKVSKTPPIELSKMVDEPVVYDEGIFVAFAPSGDGILELFKNSDWEGVPGAHNPYVQALERVIGARLRHPGRHHRHHDYPCRMGAGHCRIVEFLRL